MVAGLGLGVVVRVGLRLGGLARGGDLGAQPLQLLVEVLPVGEQLRQLAVLGVELRLLLP